MTTPLHLLIVEDMPEDAELMALRLSEEGFHLDWRRVDNEKDYRKALETAPDLVLADWSLPQFSGLRALELMNEAGLDIPFLIVSGRIGEEAAMDLLRKGAYDYVFKDRLAKLGRAVQRAMEDKRLRMERRRAEEELRKLSMAVEQSPVSVVMTDPQGNIEYVNPKFTEITGYTMEEVREKNPRILKSGETPDEDYARLWKTITSGGEWRGVFHNKRKDGTLFWERASISALRDGSGTITHFIAIKEDITAQRSLENQLQQAQKMESVGRLAGGVAHDFNNMLGVIIGHAEMALQTLDISSPLCKILQEILKAAQHSADLTRELLAFARKQMISPKVLDLNETVSHMLEMFHPLIGENIDLIWKPGSNLWPVKMDPAQIDQSLVNLLINARDAITGVGTVTIETDNVVFDETCGQAHAGLVPGEYVLLAVSDTGPGMDKQTLEHLFEPFFTTKDMGKGMGLGLSTVYGIVKQNDGYIHVSSEPGQGVTFKIYFPRCTGSMEKKAKTEALHPLNGTEIVLVVEDEPQILTLCGMMLEKQGYTILSAGHPDEALELCEKRQGPIHLLITDVIMPTMDGKELRDRIEKIKPGIKVLYMSGYTKDVIADRGVLPNGLHFLQKPFPMALLVRKVRQILDEPA